MFWLYEGDVPAGAGAERFGAVHLAYLAVFLILTVCYGFFCRKLDKGRRKKADRILGSAVLLCGLFEYGVTALIGRFSRYTLPIHLCSLLFMLTPIHAWTNSARPGSFAARLHAFLGAVLFHPGLPGVWAALLFPDWMDVPFWHYLSVSGFLAHGLVSVYAASILVKSAEAPAPAGLLRRDLRDSVVFMAVGALLMLLFDRATGTNYWFMAGPSVGSPFSAAYEGGGYGAYLLAYACAAALVTALCYGLRFLFLRGREKKRTGA